MCDHPHEAFVLDDLGDGNAAAKVPDHRRQIDLHGAVARHVDRIRHHPAVGLSPSRVSPVKTAMRNCTRVNRPLRG